MEEREALKRQIELLQNLINQHKSVHGDAPFPTAELRHRQSSASARGRGQSTSGNHPYSLRGRHYAPQSQGSWRKTHSLRNKNPQSSFAQQSSSATSTEDQYRSQPASHSISLPSHSRAKESDRTKTAALSSGTPQQKKGGSVNSAAGIRADLTEISDTYGLQQNSSSMGTSLQHQTHRHTEELQRSQSRQAVLSANLASGSSEVLSSVKSITSSSIQTTSQVQIKPSLCSQTSTKSEQTTVAPTIANAAALSKVAKQPSLDFTSLTSKSPACKSSLKQSQFTWVKRKDDSGVESRQGSSVSTATGKAVSVSPMAITKAAAASGSSPSFTVSKRAPMKKLPRKLSPVTVTPKTSKYKWVSSSARAQGKSSRKPVSPKVSLAQRALEKGEATKRLRAPSTSSVKIKRATSSSLSSRYCWKAGGLSNPIEATASVAAARRRSAFHWTAEKSNKGVKGVLVVSPTLHHRASPPSSSPSSFKLRSRMKIIRKSVISGGGSDRGSFGSAGKFSPKGRIHPSTRSPLGIRRTPSRELVSFGRHKLRRLSLTPSRTSSPTSPHCGPTSQRVYRTRYKIVTRSVTRTPHTPNYNSTLSWRAKRVQSARSLLQSRLRSPPDRHPLSTQHRRGSGMCWIGGSLYRVSANKLSRTVPSCANMSVSKTGWAFSPHRLPMSPAGSRPSSTRHFASRAVQRSLAIIRHSHQKKQQKQYCMYYNRFGKCNRGNSCPYIHDPDKVAVCTRFLRGTCKQGDRTCPFSHKVDRKKMPVCSYFLKGICNNNDCPYSHVYVSRKAEVCEDFVKGYCPAGEKCKKKHTLVCPDFSETGSCPRGTRCKLQHRKMAKRSASSTSGLAAKKAHTKDSPKRPLLSVVMPNSQQAAAGTPTSGLLALPSFISLSSSPEEPDTPDTVPAETSQAKEKKLQIKPRL